MGNIFKFEVARTEEEVEKNAFFSGKLAISRKR